MSEKASSWSREMYGVLKWGALLVALKRLGWRIEGNTWMAPETDPFAGYGRLLRLFGRRQTHSSPLIYCAKTPIAPPAAIRANLYVPSKSEVRHSSELNTDIGEVMLGINNNNAEELANAESNRTLFGAPAPETPITLTLPRRSPTALNSASACRSA